MVIGFIIGYWYCHRSIY